MTRIKDQKFETGTIESYGFGMRHIQALLVCMFVAISFIMRVNVSVAVVAMTDKTHNNSNFEIYDWPKQTQDVILSSFFWGYFTLQIPIGYLAERFGSKPLFTIAIFVNGVVNLLTPLAVHWGGWIAMCVCRALQGITQAGVFPGTIVMSSRWIPNQERSRLTNFMFSGITLGTIAGLPLSSLLASSSYGWPSIFYVIGTISIIFGVVWILLGASSPDSSKSITPEEKDYILRSIDSSHSTKKKVIPWKQILTTMPVYATQLAQIGSVWIGNIVIMEMPSYMNKILGINTKESGLYSALPFVSMWASSILVSMVSDWITNNKIISTINSRRIFNTWGTWVPATFLIAMTYIPPGHPSIVIGFFVLTATFLTSINMGFMLTYIDIAPSYSGVILGLNNFISQGIGIFAPLLVGFVVTDEHDPKQWQTVFFITSGILIFCNLFYIIFTSTEIQPWNNADSVNFKNNIEQEFNKQTLQQTEEEMAMLKQKSKNSDIA